MVDFWQIIQNAAVELISPTTAAYALAALGLAIHFGYTGLLNFGQAGFMAIGAYGYAISTLTLGFPVWGAVLVGVGGSIIFALILGIPTLRLRADYLAIVTIAASEILRLIFTTNSLDAVTGSADGLSAYKGGFAALNPFPKGTYGFGPFTMNEYDLWVRVVGWTLVILGGLLAWQLMRSPWGRVIKGIREDEDAVRALGKNVYFYKMQSLIIGGVFGTLGGMIFINFDPSPAETARDPAARWGGDNSRTDRRIDDLLGAAVGRVGLCCPRSGRRLVPRDVERAGRSDAIHHRGCGAHAPGDIQTSGHLRQQEGAGFCQVTSSRPGAPRSSRSTFTSARSSRAWPKSTPSSSPIT